MTKQEFEEEIKTIDDERKHKIYEARKRYAFANRTFEIGDTITDGFFTIVVDEIQFVNSKEPTCRYYGVKVDQKVIEFIDGERGAIDQARAVIVNEV